ncbi:MAG: tellurite resistance TerB family protein [Alphaproteobacteria bacterium]
MSRTINHHSALVYVMVTMSAVDGKMKDQEIRRIGTIVRNLPVFNGFSEERLVPTSQECAAILSEDEGLATVLGLVVEALPVQLHETAYALAVEVAAADLHVEQEELRFLQMLRDQFALDKLVTAAIERGARARHAVAPV